VVHSSLPYFVVEMTLNFMAGSGQTRQKAIKEQQRQRKREL
jgi:hypothetical protein